MLSSERLQLSSRSQCQSDPELELGGLGRCKQECIPNAVAPGSLATRRATRAARSNHCHRIFYFCCSFLSSRNILVSRVNHKELSRTFHNWPARWPHATRPPSHKFNYLEAKGFEARISVETLLSIFVQFGFSDTFGIFRTFRTSLRVCRLPAYFSIASRRQNK